jgi:hypothetical protein
VITVVCVGVSDAIGPIHSHVGWALESGDITPEEIDEVILQFSAYSGFPGETDQAPVYGLDSGRGGPQIDQAGQG